MSKRKFKKLKKKRIGIDKFGHKEVRYVLKMVNASVRNFR